MSIQKKKLGERLETGQYNENTSEHLHRYGLFSDLCRNKKVLDIACGEGYGSNLLSKKASFVSGVDIDAQTVLNAQQKYTAANLEFKTGSADKIPFENGTFDIVISFETLEHHDKHDEMMKEIKRVLKPGGISIISTPDKLIYSDRKNFKNEFHVKELYKHEFEKLLQDNFKNVMILKQHFFSGSLIVPDKNSDMGSLKILQGDFQAVQENQHIDAEYLIGIVSDHDVSFDGTSLFLDYGYTENKIVQFQQSSLRYKVGKFVLSPFRIFKKNK